MPGTMLDLPSPYPEDDDDELDSQSSETDDELFGLAQLLPSGMIRFVEVSFVRLVAMSAPRTEYFPTFDFFPRLREFVSVPIPLLPYRQSPFSLSPFPIAY